MVTKALVALALANNDDMFAQQLLDEHLRANDEGQLPLAVAVLL